MSDKCQHASALSQFNQAIIRSNIAAKEERTKHIMLCTELISVHNIIFFVCSHLATVFDLMMAWLK